MENSIPVHRLLEELEKSGYEKGSHVYATIEHIAQGLRGELNADRSEVYSKSDEPGDDDDLWELPTDDDSEANEAPEELWETYSDTEEDDAPKQKVERQQKFLLVEGGPWAHDPQRSSAFSEDGDDEPAGDTSDVDLSGNVGEELIQNEDVSLDEELELHENEVDEPWDEDPARSSAESVVEGDNEPAPDTSDFDSEPEDECKCDGGCHDVRHDDPRGIGKRITKVCCHEFGSWDTELKGCLAKNEKVLKLVKSKGALSVTAIIMDKKKKMPKKNTDKWRRLMRHAAYKWLVAWCDLRGSSRLALPRCTMRLIRRTYPDSKGRYTGFIVPTAEKKTTRRKR
eukprot:sb/3466425/